jgi:hypothetical protein
MVTSDEKRDVDHARNVAEHLATFTRRAEESVIATEQLATAAGLDWNDEAKHARLVELVRSMSGDADAEELKEAFRAWRDRVKELDVWPLRDAAEAASELERALERVR